jgi:hypothetical protein
VTPIEWLDREVAAGRLPATAAPAALEVAVEVIRSLAGTGTRTTQKTPSVELDVLSGDGGSSSAPSAA